MKRCLTLLLALLMCLSLLPLGALASDAPNLDGASSGTCGENLTWELDDKGTLTISGKGGMKKYDGFAPNLPPWYDSRQMIYSAVIQKGVTSIGDYAFQACSRLTSVTIPDSVTSIGNWVFYDCSRLTSVTIPDSVTSTGKSAFHGCGSLTSVTLPDSMTSIGAAMFQNCTCLTSVSIPKGVTSIGERMFFCCYDLTSVTIPNSVTSIGKDAFCCCSSLTSVTIPGSVTSIGVSAFNGCVKLTSVTIPDGVTSIGDYAFAGSGLACVTIPSSVIFIGDYAFKNTGWTGFWDSSGSLSMYRYEGLKDVFFAGTEAEWNTISAYADVPSDAVIHFNSTGPVSLSKAKVTAKAQTYTGEELEPAPTVKLSGKTLTADVDYVVTGYTKNKSAGTATVTVQGVGAYTGEATGNFTIKKASNKITVSSTQFYTGYSTKTQKIQIDASATAGKLTYTIASTDNSSVKLNKSTGLLKLPAKFTGTVTITISGKATKNYKAPKDKTVTVTVLDTPTITSVESNAAKKLTATWSKVAGATGYELQYVKTKKFAADSDTATLKKTTKTLSKLTSGKTYRVRVRAYKTLKSGETVYSGWSNVQSVKVK